MSIHVQFAPYKLKEGDWTTRKAWHSNVTVVPIKHPRDHFWRWADYDGDGRTDLIVGHGDWTSFGWFDKNEWWKGYNWQGVWTGSPAHGRVFLLRNEGSDDEPRFENAKPILANGAPVNVFGRPGQMLADFDGDKDLDLLCGEFLDGFTYFQNTGTRTEPKYSEGRRLSRETRPFADIATPLTVSQSTCFTRLAGSGQVQSPGRLLLVVRPDP